VFDAAYDVEVAHWRDQVEIWPSVKRELRRAVALLPLLWVNLRAKWDNVVVATDASKWGAEVYKGGRMRRRSPAQDANERDGDSLAVEENDS
jgi:hypothetical protein